MCTVNGHIIHELENNCAEKENCKDSDNAYCCEQYREKAHNKCFVGKKCPWNCCK